MRYHDIVDAVKYYYKESKVFMPNEVFDDLKDNIKTTPHVAFSYSYIYLITYLYRYAKYFNVPEVLNNAKVKELLGYNPKQQTLDYLIKRNGLLDEIGYTETTRDFPFGWVYKVDDDEGLSFQLSSELEKSELSILSVPKQFFIKNPLKAFSRIIVEEDGTECEIEGTFYNVSNTHSVSFEAFMFCMSNSKIGCVGFYLYSYLKSKNDIHTDGYDVSLEKIEMSTGISRSTLIKYLGVLRSYKMIDVTYNQEYFSLAIKEEDRLPNTYTVRDYKLFSSTPKDYKKIGYKTKDEHSRIVEAQGMTSSVDGVSF